jgi:hypothetical protein
MSVFATAWAIRQKCRTHSALNVLHCIAHHSTMKGNGCVECFLYVETIARESNNLSVRNTYKALSELESDGLIVRVKQPGPRSKNVYRLPSEAGQSFAVDGAEEDTKRHANPPRRPSSDPSRASHDQAVRPPQQPISGPNADGIRGRDFARPDAQRHAA